MHYPLRYALLNTNTQKLEIANIENACTLSDVIDIIYVEFVMVFTEDDRILIKIL